MPRLLLATYRILIVTVLLLVAVIAAGTVLALARRAPVAGAAEARTADQGGPEGLEARRTGTDRRSAYFTGVGRIRAATTDARPATVIVSIAFPYDKTDVPFSEELAAKTREFRQVAAELFSSYPGDRLRKTSEAELKAELLRRYNALLRLGKIEAIYFNDYLIVD
jgi:flagellar basal body-associated protein FliL